MACAGFRLEGVCTEFSEPIASSVAPFRSVGKGDASAGHAPRQQQLTKLRRRLMRLVLCVAAL